MRILVVEDHSVLRTLVLQQLRALGYAGEGVKTGAEAVRRLMDDDFSLILMDIGVPELDGADHLQQVRQVQHIAKQKRIPIVATTAMADRQKCMEAGMDDYIAKPVLLDQLESTLSRWLKTKSNSEKCVLIVEDDSTNRKVMSVLLERMGLEHDFATDGTEAVAMARAKDYALILMDIRMPQLDGYRATKAIRASLIGRKDVPIVAVTAQAMDGDLEKCIWAGMNDYLPKPYTPEELELVVHRWLK